MAMAHTLCIKAFSCIRIKAGLSCYTIRCRLLVASLLHWRPLNSAAFTKPLTFRVGQTPLIVVIFAIFSNPAASSEERAPVIRLLAVQTHNYALDLKRIPPMEWTFCTAYSSFKTTRN